MSKCLSDILTSEFLIYTYANTDKIVQTVNVRIMYACGQIIQERISIKNLDHV